MSKYYFQVPPPALGREVLTGAKQRGAWKEGRGVPALFERPFLLANATRTAR